MQLGMISLGRMGAAMVRRLAGKGHVGDIVIDGGNSRYHDDIRRARERDAAMRHEFGGHVETPPEKAQ